jgi:hypothetical protein
MANMQLFRSTISWAKYFVPTATKEERQQAADLLRIALIELEGGYGRIRCAKGENIIPITRARELVGELK